MDHFVPNAVDGGETITSWVMSVDSYLYDSLNRLHSVTETPTGGSGLSQACRELEWQEIQVKPWLKS